ncbi:MAG: sulfatase-like hydrolase/transferase, partial [Bacteroidetes bacterium]|nr:sulfatase-like hydrolase/transferase [Bacteroidota bacterium]
LFTIKSLSFTNWAKEKNQDDYKRAESPIFAFAHSYYSHWFIEFPHLELEEAHEDDVETDVSEEKTTFISHPAIKHVVVVVLESVQAGYVAGYDSLYAVTPNIQQHLRDALVVSNAYAHTPNSTNSLFSLHSSLYPLLSFRTLIKEQPDFNAPTISAVLKENDYQTAFFTSTDYTYCRVDEYLANQQYDTIVDYKGLICKPGSINSEAEGVGVVKPESCLVDRHIAWMEQQQGMPSFSMLWTVQTHWSYFVFGKEEAYAIAGNNTDLNKYLNALRETDQAVGKLFSYLHNTGKYDSTLVVLVGDHGEAFGQHKQYGHGSNIYEENVRVPLIFINPLLFKQERTESITGHIDIAPTILDILDIAAPAEWQGRSVFDANRPNRTYFFSTWTDYLYGYREGATKVIYNLYKDKAMVFNLQDDPEEQRNLAAEMPATVATGKKKISRWVQQHRKFMDRKSQMSVSAEKFLGQQWRLQDNGVCAHCSQ